MRSGCIVERLLSSSSLLKATSSLKAFWPQFERFPKGNILFLGKTFQTKASFLGRSV